MKDNDSKLIWESWTSSPEHVAPQVQESDTRELDDHGREYIYKAPRRGHSSEEEMIQVLKQLPQGMGEMFKPDREGSFLVLTPSDKFKSYGTSGDGMGDVIEHNLGFAIVGLADGNFLEYIKHAPPEEEDPDADVNHQTLNDYMRGL